MFFSKNEKPNTNWLNQYFKFNISGLEKNLTRKKETYWQSLGQKNALEIFHAAAEKVPAYKDFLKKNKVIHAKIKTIADFSQIPPTDKQNYIQTYSLNQRSWHGQVTDSKLIASSSGTSGSPNYWPRGGGQEYEAAITHELLFRQLFNIQKLKTLCIVGFPMGVYVSGMATSLPLWVLSQKYNLSLLSAGNNKTEVLKAVKNLGKNFEQILLVGHPFFIKDVLETGKAEGVDWKKTKVGMMFCSEGFSEAWREYLLKEAGLNGARAYNTYGSSEMLLMAYETQTSIQVRKLLEQQKSAAYELLGNAQVPNLFQYNPALRFIEEKGKELLFTSASGLPLIRFNLHDAGKILSREKVLGTAEKYKPEIAKHEGWQLPFVSLEGRSDYTVIFYAANIYPQHIHAGLGNAGFISKITGKFTMTKGYRKNMDEYLEINIELRQKVKINGKLRHHIQKTIVEKLKEINAEYNFLWQNLNKDIRPQIKLWQYQHPKYFTPGLKPHYIANP